MTSKTRMKSHEQFCAEVKTVHGDAIQVIDKYKGALVRVRLRCSQGHTWKSIPHVSLSGSGCKECFNASQRKTNEQFKQELFAWNPRFELRGTYTGDGKYVKIKCIPCDHTWSLIANTALKQKWCPKCVNEGRKQQPHKLTTQEIVERIRAKNPHYKVIGAHREPGQGRTRQTVTVKCRHCHGVFKKTLGSLLQHSSKCACKLGVNSGRGYSTRSIQWLDEIARKNRKVIQHAECGGEFRIPEHRLYVDGYHKRSNTVFEFLGDYWHKHVSPDARKKTMQRLRKIKSLGYRVVFIWESDYIKGKSAKYL